jgi:hypothetical protein
MHQRNAVLTLLLAVMLGAGLVEVRPAAAQGTTTIGGVAFQETVLRNFLQDPGEPPIVGATVELWSTTSLTGQPQRLQTTQTDSQGRYQFTVNAINGPLPDFGCYQVRLILPANLGGGVIRSDSLCRVPASDGGTVGVDFTVSAGITPLPPPNPPPGQNQGLIQGTVFQETVQRNFLQEPGEPGVPGLPVELWSTTSITGKPARITATQTDANGHYQFVVDAINGSRPDFGCYEVRLILASSISAALVIRSQPVCQVPTGGTQRLDFPLPGGGGTPTPFPPVPPPTTGNRAPAAIYIQSDTGVAPGGVLRMQALGVDPEDDCLTYAWSASGGAFAAQEGSLADWQAPNQPGQYQITVRATDPQGGAMAGQVTINVAANTAFDHAPSLQAITASDVTPAPGQVVQLTARASDPDGDALQNLFHFYNAAGARVGPFDVLWQAPTQAGIYRAYGVVFDNRGGFGFNIRELSVNSAQALNRSHPSYGRAGQVLIDSFGRLMWVGINDPATAQQAAALAASGAQRWVLGRIVPDPSQKHCFYLDPSAVSFAEVTAEGIQTTVEQIERQPSHFAPGGAGGFDTWAISGRLLEFAPAQ